MSGGCGVILVSSRKPRRKSGIMHGKLNPPHRLKVLISLSQFPCCPHRSQGQDLSKTCLISNRLCQSPNGFCISPGQLNSLWLLLGEYPISKAFDSPGNTTSHRYGVQTISITNIITFDDRFRIIVQGHSPKGRQGFIFRTICLSHRPFSGVHLIMSPATERTVSTSIFLCVVLGIVSKRCKLRCGFLPHVYNAYTAPVLYRCVSTSA